MSHLILMRHGQSIWNERNLFTGWVDVPLSQKGIDEALKASDLLKNTPIDIVFTSTLIRAEMTAYLALLNHQSGKVPIVQHTENGNHDKWHRIHSLEGLQDAIPVFRNSALNERMYGSLQGKNKDEARKSFGTEKVEEWRRSFRTAPPEGESLAETSMRTLPYFYSEIVPRLDEGLNVLVAAHGNSLRAIMMAIENISEEEIPRLEIPTGVPIFYTYEETLFVKGNY